jgi:hypothetical protein
MGQELDEYLLGGNDVRYSERTASLDGSPMPVILGAG